MTTVTISLPESLRDFVESQVKTGATATLANTFVDHAIIPPVLSARGHAGGSVRVWYVLVWRVTCK